MNDQIKDYLKALGQAPSDENMVQTESDIVSGILSFDCVVGQKNCIYQDKKNLAQGVMTNQAKAKLSKTLVKTSDKKLSSTVTTKKPVPAIKVA